MSKKFYKLSEHKDEIITALINNIIWVPVTLLAPSAVKIAKTLVEKILTNESFEISTLIDIFSIIGIVFSIVVFICDYIFKYKKKNKKENPQDDSNSDSDSDQNNSNSVIKGLEPIENFRIKSLDAEFFIKSEKEMISTLDYCLVAKKDGIEYFEKDFIWTGKECHGIELVDPSNSNYELVVTSKNNSYCTYRVLFNEEIKHQNELKFKLKTTVSDEGKTMMPYYAYTVKHQIDVLRLRVVVNRNSIRRVKHSVYLDALRELKVGESTEIKRKIVGNYDCYEISINNPTLLYRYFIEWEFTK